MNSFGRHLRVSLFGESHGQGVGAILDGLPAGLRLPEDSLRKAMAQRRPGQSPLVSSRQEPDEVEILTGARGGVATGAPLTLWIPNRDAQSKPYEAISTLPRPSHGDYTQWVSTGGHADLRGGGHLSGRLTAPWVAAGAIAQALLGEAGVVVGAHLHQVGEVRGPDYAFTAAAMAAAEASELHTAHAGLEGAFRERIETARRARDSVGAVVEFACSGLPAGLGDPWFDSVESLASHALFSIPAVKGVEFGAGFRAATLSGSQHNDPFEPARPPRPGQAVPSKNDAGGVLGGRTSGAPVCGHVAVKPTATISQPQLTVDLGTGGAAPLQATGRHDPCIGVRAVPAVQGALRLVCADLLLGGRA
ncbi:MAG: chorismate synthase [Thermoplasmatota archaeon]